MLLSFSGGKPDVTIIMYIYKPVMMVKFTVFNFDSHSSWLYNVFNHRAGIIVWFVLLIITGTMV